MTQLATASKNKLDAQVEALRASDRHRAPSARAFSDIVRERVDQDRDCIVISQGDTAITRGEMFDAACRLGGALLERGIANGSNIAFQLPNWWEACVINLAAALFGYRVVPLLTIYRRAELGYMLSECGVDAIFVPGEVGKVDYVETVRTLDEPPAHIFTVRGGIDGPNAFEQLLRYAAAPISPAASDDAKLVLFTSGSTGHPKGVIHTQSTIDALIRQAAEFWQIDQDDVLYVPSPIGHIGGSIYAFDFPWITGCKTVLAEAWHAPSAVRDIERYQATFMAGATPFLSGLIEAAQEAKTTLPSLRRYICGGASVPPELVRLGLKTFNNAIVSRAFGSTEVPLVCPGVSDRADAEAYADTDGECKSELLLLNEAGQSVGAAEIGEIAVRAPQMFVGYLNAKDDEGCFTPDGFFKTGDLGRLVDGRYLEITGRIKDMIIRKGENISPLEIENALARHDGVEQSAVIGVPDVERGEMVVAFVKPAEGCKFTFDEMISHLDSLGFAKQKFPERLEVVPSFPINSIGKIEKTKLRAAITG